MINLFNAAVIAAISIFYLNEPLEGRWESKPSVNGNVTGVVFKADGTFMSYINKKPFASGVYSLKDSLFSISDNGCANTGTYKAVFFANDSLKFQPVLDSCADRARGISRLVLGRVKQPL